MIPHYILKVTLRENTFIPGNGLVIQLECGNVEDIKYILSFSLLPNPVCGHPSLFRVWTSSWWRAEVTHTRTRISVSDLRKGRKVFSPAKNEAVPPSRCNCNSPSWPLGHVPRLAKESGKSLTVEQTPQERASYSRENGQWETKQKSMGPSRKNEYFQSCTILRATHWIHRKYRNGDEENEIQAPLNCSGR